MKCTWLIVALLATALAPCAVSQMRGGGFGRGAGFAGHRSRGLGQSAVFFSDPYLYADYPSGSLTSAMPSAPALVMRPPDAPEPRRESLLIELQGDRYVRLSGDEQSDRAESAESATTRSVRTQVGPSLIPVALAARELPPAVLIFRDGHEEQVQDYVISGGTLYARGDYWQTGSWRKDIQLSVLDIPATLIANQNHGVKFVLPSGPNEVVTRP
jgi:hypothetical protein